MGQAAVCLRVAGEHHRSRPTGSGRWDQDLLGRVPPAEGDAARTPVDSARAPVDAEDRAALAGLQKAHRVLVAGGAQAVRRDR
jgi:hypothetical protein